MEDNKIFKNFLRVGEKKDNRDNRDNFFDDKL